MHQKLFGTLFISFTLLMASSAIAEESQDNQLNFLGGMAMAYKNISFEIPAGGVSFSPNLMMFNTSGTLSYGRFFATINYDETIRDDTEFSPNNSSLILMTRNDMDISAGAYLGAGFSIFGGYKDGTLHADVAGETTGGPTPTCPLALCPVNPFEVEFRDKGPFVGLSYTASLADSSLALNVAYADLDGEVFFGNNGGSKTSGDTSGFSYSIAWNVPVGESTTFTPKVNIIRYEFDDTKMGTRSGGGGAQDLSYTQDFDVVSFTLAHYF